jgi:hypothetical protein
MQKERDGILVRLISGSILIFGAWALFWLLLSVWKVPAY